MIGPDDALYGILREVAAPGSDSDHAVLPFGTVVLGFDPVAAETVVMGSGLTYDSRGRLTGGTIDKLVERLDGGGTVGVIRGDDGESLGPSIAEMARADRQGALGAKFADWSATVDAHLTEPQIRQVGLIVNGSDMDLTDNDDRATGSDRGDFIDGRLGQDSLYGEQGKDYLFGDDSGVIELGADDGEAGGSDRLYGGQGRDSLYDNEGDDTPFGGTDGDWLHDASGTDRMNGGDGADLFWGKEGDDFFKGGAGADTFVFAAPGAEGVDRIGDFASGEDRLGIELSLRAGYDVGSIGAWRFKDLSLGRQVPNDLTLWDPRTGAVSVVPQGGDGEAILIGRLAPGTAIDVGDLLIG